MVAAATVAESTHSIQLILLNRDGQAGSTLPLAQFRPSFGYPSLLLLSFPPRAVRICVRRKFSNIVLCLLLVAWLLLYRYSLTGCAASPAGKCNLNTAGVKACLAGFIRRRIAKTESPNRPKPSALPLCVEYLRFHLEETDP